MLLGLLWSSNKEKASLFQVQLHSSRKWWAHGETEHISLFLEGPFYHVGQKADCCISICDLAIINRELIALLSSRVGKVGVASHQFQQLTFVSTTTTTGQWYTSPSHLVLQWKYSRRTLDLTTPPRETWSVSESKKEGLVLAPAKASAWHDTRTGNTQTFSLWMKSRLWVVLLLRQIIR